MIMGLSMVMGCLTDLWDDESNSKNKKTEKDKKNKRLYSFKSRKKKDYEY